ncbi:MAG: sigma-E factor regulatory protein RseB domain-containing protein [Mycobacteriales bacterium]
MPRLPAIGVTLATAVALLASLHLAEAPVTSSATTVLPAIPPPGAALSLAAVEPLLAVLGVPATGPAVRAGTLRSPLTGAVPVLEAAARAVRALSYHGTQFVTFFSAAGDSSIVVDVAHQAGRGLQLDLPATVSTPGLNVFTPDTALTRPTDSAGAIGRAPLALLAAHYRLRLAGTALVAGRVAVVVVASWPNGVPAARFWIDRATSLPLRRAVYDPQGRLMRASAFVNLQVGPVRLSPTDISPGGPSPRDVVLPAPDGALLGPTGVTALHRAGWRFPDALPPQMVLIDARVGGSAAEPLLHLTYTDGLFTMSLFEQQGVLDQQYLSGWRHRVLGRTPVWTSTGGLARAAWQAGPVVATVVTDAPNPAVDEMLNAAIRSLPASPPPPGVWGRLRNGLDRIGDWLDPLN